MEQFFQPNILKYTGAWPLPNDRPTQILARAKCLLSTMFILFCAWSCACDGLQNSSDVYYAFKGVVGASMSLQCMLKNGSFLVRRGLLRDIILLTRDLHGNTPLGCTHPDIVGVWRTCNTRTQHWIKLIAGSFLPVLTMLVAFPWCLYWLTSETDVFILTLFSSSHMPLDAFVRLYFAEQAVGFCVITVQISATILFSSCVLFVCSCVDVLRCSMDTATRAAAEQQRVPGLFGKCVTYHNVIFELIGKIEELYSVLLLTQFVVSSTVICIVSFLLSQVDFELGQRITFIMYFIGTNIEMFVFCYFGQMVQTKFEQLHTSGFHYAWCETSPVYQKHVCFYLLRCSRPVVLRAGKFININLEYYYSLCKVTMSYYTLLQSVVEDNELE